MTFKKVIVVGASAGGIEALKKLVAQLPVDFPAAIFITQHLYRRSESTLPAILAGVSRLPVKHPTVSEPIIPGRIYIAPPDYHLVLSPGLVTLGHGPKENLQRPCINLMFRSAAASYGRNAIGVLITGMLDDGASGLWEIKQHGGITIVQDPQEALYPSMPESAVRGFQVDHVVPLVQMGPLLETLVSEGVDVSHPENLTESSDLNTDCGQSCPECGGVMKATRHDLLYEYQCHVGHRLGLKTMIAEKTENVERMLLAALAQTEELSDLLVRAQNSDDESSGLFLAAEIESRRQQAHSLRELLELQVSRHLDT
jgi:two-component system, chemotaxis family, protein-glutamate methylesterase/glutaminase